MKNLLTYHDLLQRYIRHSTFPLKLQAVTQVDSRNSPAAQLADLVIGAAIEAANTLTRQRAGALDAREVMALYADHHPIHMLPSINYDQQKRVRQGTQAPQVIHYFPENFHKP